MTELVPALHTPPADCTGDCGWGPCNCSGEWRCAAYTRESVEAKIREVELAAGAIVLAAGGEVTVHPRHKTARIDLARFDSAAGSTTYRATER